MTGIVRGLQGSDEVDRGTHPHGVAILSPWDWGGGQEEQAQARLGAPEGEWGHTGNGGLGPGRVEPDSVSLPQALPNLWPLAATAMPPGVGEGAGPGSAAPFSVAGCMQMMALYANDVGGTAACVQGPRDPRGHLWDPPEGRRWLQREPHEQSVGGRAGGPPPGFGLPTPPSLPPKRSP